MNEVAKTGIYWLAAVVMLGIALLVTRSPETDSSTQSQINQPLFPSFTDPLAASTMRIVTFDEEQGEIAKFEVAKDEKTGVWSLPSRDNYPADAAEQMKNAANALLNVKILDIQTENPEDHASLGVMEPNEDSLEAGDEGVGRLVTLKGGNNATLAAVIVGKPVKGREGQRYVRIPGQDPVYVVALDDKPLSTKFEDWIEKDLLQLSSIDISDVEIQNYDAALELGNQLALNRSYDAKLSIDGSNAWQLDSLVEYGADGEKKEIKLAEGEKLATAKLNSLKNALDELKIVDVASKPKGMSENLKADKDLVSDQQAVLSLAGRGFFPVTQGDILSANGEMTVSLKDGVQYVLRFGNVEGLADAKKDEAKPEDAAEDAPKDPASSGANRYLLVTTRVDETKFPAPDLKAIPKTVEELEAAEAAEAAASASSAEPSDTATPDAGDAPAEESSGEPTEPASEEEMKEGDAAASQDSDSAAAPPEESPKVEAAESTDAPTEGEAVPETENPAAPANEPATAEAVEGTTEQTGEGSASGSGQGQDEPEAASDAAPGDAAAPDTAPAGDDTAPAGDEPAPSDKADAAPKDAASPATSPETSATPDAASPDAVPAVETPAEAMPADTKEATPEEKQERLEAEQEKITKENQRKIDERKDKLEAAERKVRELNGRFAGWYYVIPEATYRNLRLSREELIEKPAAAGSAPTAPDESSASPSIQLPNFGN